MLDIQNHYFHCVAQCHDILLMLDVVIILLISFTKDPGMELEESTDSLEIKNREARLDEILGWLLKMGFSVEDILKWATDQVTKKKTQQRSVVPDDHETEDRPRNRNGISRS